MDILKKLTKIADDLDQKGLHKEADKIDKILKESGVIDWVKEFFMGKKTPECTCNCESCTYAKSAYNRPAIALKYHMQCEQDCQIKAAAKQ